MTLHEAIISCLKVVGDTSSKIVASIINHERLYERKDGRPVEASQVLARIKNYPYFFGINKDGNIYLKQAVKLDYQRLVYQLQDVLRDYDVRNFNIIVSIFIFLERVRNVFPHYLPDKFLRGFILDYEELFNRPTIGHFQTAFELSEGDEEMILELIKYIPIDTQLKIEDFLKEYDFSIDAYSHKQFGTFFNQLINSFSLVKSGFGGFVTPQVVNIIISGLCDLKEGDSIFDPFAGNAGTFCNLLQSKKINYSLTLNDIDTNAILLAKMNLVVNNIHSFKYNYINSFEDFIYENDEIKYDWVITHPPLNLRIGDVALTYPFRTRLFDSNKSDLLILELILQKLNSTGKAIVLVPESFLFSNTKAHQKARRFLVDNSLLTSIISLPVGAFQPYSSLKTSILFINNDISEGINEGVSFINLSQEDLKNITQAGTFSMEDFIRENPFQFKFIEKDKIADEKYSLSTNRYGQPTNHFTSKEYKKLKEITTSFSGFNYKAADLTRTGGIPYVNIKDLSNEKKFFYLNREKIDTYISLELRKKNNLIRNIKKDSILIAKVGNKLKPTLNVSDKPIVVSGNILVLEPKPEIVSATYLLSQFYEDYVLSQIERIRGGVTQSFVNLSDLLNIYIKVPSFEVQKEEELKFAYEQIENSLIKDSQNLTNLKEEIDLSSAIEHEYKNLKNPLDSNIANVKDFLDRKIKRNEVLTWDDKIAENQKSRSIGKVFEDINEIMYEMSSLIEDIVTVSNLGNTINLLNKKNVSPLDYFERVAKKMQREFPEVDLVLQYEDKKELRSVILEINENLFDKVIRNFVLNSLKHGYEGSVQKPVDIKLSMSEDNLDLQIDLIDYGKGFDFNYTYSDFISFGKKTSNSKGSGIGGFIMNQIILKHEGTMEMVKIEKEGEKNVRATMKTGAHFRIKLPIIK